LRVLVTGASGFVGKYILKYLFEHTDDEIIAVRGLGHFKQIPYPKSRLVWRQVDITNKTFVKQLIKETQPDRVYHLAGIAATSGISREVYFRVNVTGTHNLGSSILDACGSKTKMLYVSSAAVYGSAVTEGFPINEKSPIRPENDYGVSKACAETVLWPLWRKGLDVRIVRPFNHTGPGQQQGFVCPDLIERLTQMVDTNPLEMRNFKLGVRHLESVRDFVDVRDVVRGYVKIMESFSSGEVVNLASGIRRRLYDVASMLCEFARVTNKLEVELYDDSSDQVHDDEIVGDSGLLESRTGWVPYIPFEKTLREMWEAKVSGIDSHWY
jgi:GDP-4-dehydro-6-deoxy-D-mannose reductase